MYCQYFHQLWACGTMLLQALSVRSLQLPRWYLWQIQKRSSYFANCLCKETCLPIWSGINYTDSIKVFILMARRTLSIIIRTCSSIDSWRSLCSICSSCPVLVSTSRRFGQFHFLDLVDLCEYVTINVVYSCLVTNLFVSMNLNDSAFLCCFVLLLVAQVCLFNIFKYRHSSELLFRIYKTSLWMQDISVHVIVTKQGYPK